MDEYEKRIGPCRSGKFDHEDPDNTGMCFKCGKILDPTEPEDDEWNRDKDANL